MEENSVLPEYSKGFCLYFHMKNRIENQSENSVVQDMQLDTPSP